MAQRLPPAVSSPGGTRQLEHRPQNGDGDDKADPWRAERIEKGDEFVTANLGGNIIEASIPALVRQFALMKANGVSGFLYWNFICGYGDSNRGSAWPYPARTAARTPSTRTRPARSRRFAGVR